MVEARELRVRAGNGRIDVSALLLEPPGAQWLFVFAHGAGAGMRHGFMEQMAARMAEHRIATFRFQFPYTERGQRRPDPVPALVETIRAAVAAASAAVPQLPLIAGGKSMGGRLTSVAQADTPLAVVRGLVFLGFPLHAPGKPSIERGAHLSKIFDPMLFLQGTRDKLAALHLLRPVCDGLPQARLHIVEDADHSFHVTKKSGRSDRDVSDELARTVSGWAHGLT